MQIAYLSTFYPFRGGIAQFNASLYREFQKMGHNVDAFTFTCQYPSFLFPGETQYVQKGDIADIINSERILNTANPFTYLTASKKIKKIKPDLLLMKYWMSYFAPSLGYVAGSMKSKTKVITILDNVISHEKRFFDKAFTKYFLDKNDGFIAMSEKVKNDLLHYKPDAKVTLIPHPLYDHFGKIVDKTAARKELNIDTNKKTILFFGFIRDYKGLDLLINAFGELDKSYQLIIAGEVYGNFDKYDELILKNPNKENIHKYIKYISDNEVNTYFSAADVCILPYKGATQSGITGISYHFETPMIATDVGGLSEIIHHNKTGFIVDAPSSKAITEGIIEYFNNCDTELLKQNIRTLKKELSWENFAEQLIDFYYKLK
ncbi:MAG: glycosyltransferase [Bacteroidales bacterium]|jgi:glycosyltransferase involved in cell wall biosynthesis|nr:glycosyltransferase [Bacteroidales bacterium]